MLLLSDASSIKLPVHADSRNIIFEEACKEVELAHYCDYLNNQLKLHYTDICPGPLLLWKWNKLLQKPA